MERLLSALVHNMGAAFCASPEKAQAYLGFRDSGLGFRVSGQGLRRIQSRGLMTWGLQGNGLDTESRP